MSALLARLQGDLTGARKAQDKPLLLMLRTVVAEDELTLSAAHPDVPPAAPPA